MEIRLWNTYIKEDIVLLCGKDRATGDGAETFNDGVETMAEEEENEVNSTDTSRPASSTANEPKSQDKKRARKDALAVQSNMLLTLFGCSLRARR
ncbi:hypothetical protein ACH5RR_033684 [Cinchona calisaya]|uniref:Uncharacterized protein n=1 Tax=Cinchona calisaya TaxID=153742 RepID=A0ABD2YA05_9GENT